MNVIFGWASSGNNSDNNNNENQNAAAGANEPASFLTQLLHAIGFSDWFGEGGGNNGNGFQVQPNNGTTEAFEERVYLKKIFFMFFLSIGFSVTVGRTQDSAYL